MTPRRLEPVAAVGYPPGGEKSRNGGGAGPPEGKQDIGHQPEQHEDYPEYFFLHCSDCKPGGLPNSPDVRETLVGCAWDARGMFVALQTGFGIASTAGRINRAV